MIHLIACRLNIDRHATHRIDRCADLRPLRPRTPDQPAANPQPHQLNQHPHHYLAGRDPPDINTHQPRSFMLIHGPWSFQLWLIMWWEGGRGHGEVSEGARVGTGSTGPAG